MPEEAPTTAKAISGKLTQVGGGIEPGAEVDVQIRERFQGILSGKIKRFGKEAKALKKQQLFSSIMARRGAEERGLESDLLARGVSRGGVMARGRTELRSTALQAYGEGVNQMELEAINAEFDDRNNALNSAQKWLDSRRSYELQKEQIQAQREATAAQISLGYAQIKAGKENARMAAGAARAGLGLAREQFEFSKTRYEESKITLPSGDRVPPSTWSTMMGYATSGP